jgi:hypothetical protein
MLAHKINGLRRDRKKIRLAQVYRTKEIGSCRLIPFAGFLNRKIGPVDCDNMSTTPSQLKSI